MLRYHIVDLHSELIQRLLTGYVVCEHFESFGSSVSGFQAAFANMRLGGLLRASLSPEVRRPRDPRPGPGNRPG